MKKVLKEWSITVPWGRIALTSWGDPSKQPMLLVHGRQDSLSTFIPLLELLPDEYHYVGFDLPGHGQSDPLPYGLQLMRLHFVRAVEQVVNHLGWRQFVYLAHSFGGELGILYAAFHPGRISRMILLDTVVIALRTIQIADWPKNYKDFHQHYYSNYSKFNIDKRTYTKEKAVQVVMKARGLTRELAELVLERNLRQIGDDTYKLNWGMRLKMLAPINICNEAYSEMIRRNDPPTLFLVSRDSMEKYATKEVYQLVEQLKNRSKLFEVITYDGGHDYHLTCPEKVAKSVVEFLKRDFVKAKL